MKILVTGFEPFGGESRNPSAEVAAALPKNVAGAEIVTCILPVERGAAAERAEEAIRVHRPDAVISVGQAGGRAAVTVEQVAVNLEDYSIPDNGGNLPANEPVIPGGPDAYLVDLPVPAMVEAIRRAGIPAQRSMTAGTFVCNHLLYRVSHLLRREFPGVRCGFIHIPWLPQQVTDKPGQPSMELSLSVRAVTAAIEAVVSEMRQRP